MEYISTQTRFKSLDNEKHLPVSKNYNYSLGLLIIIINLFKITPKKQYF